MKKLAALLLLLSAPAGALWQGKLDLDPTVAPIVIRELHDGQWLAGVTKENLWHLDHDGAQRLHAGVFQAWNAEKGNASLGLVAGVDLPAYLGPALQALGSALGLGETFKPLQYFSSVLSLDAIGGYRPLHSPDVHSWVYGAGARLNIGFGVQELKRGL